VTAAVPLGVEPAPVRTMSADSGLRWVHDPEDDQACLHDLTALHDLGAGRVVCHPTPGATWPILTRDLLEALGKRRDALAQARRVGDGAALVRTWIRAERVRHLIVLRAHRLRPPLLAAPAELATAAAVTVWLVWHDTDPPAPTGEVWDWPGAVTALRHPSRPGGTSRLRPAEQIYREAVAEARREARLWRVAPPRQRRFTQPGCGLGAMLQRLTIDAATPADLEMRVAAARAGFAAEGLALIVAAAPAELGPRITPPVMDRLRRIACPTSAAALLLAVATDARAGRIADCRPGWISPDAKQVTLLTGTYRIPEVARPLLRAALLDHQDRGLPTYALFTRRDGGLLLAQAMSHSIARAAAIADVPDPHAATPAGRSDSDSGPETPFAAALVNAGARIDGAGSPPRPRPHLPPRH
jgi:hypothetical protein